MSVSIIGASKPTKSDPKVEALYRSRSVEESMRAMIQVMSRVSVIVILVLLCVIVEFGYSGYTIEHKYSATTISCWQARRGILGLESNLFKMCSNPSAIDEYKTDMAAQEELIRSRLAHIDSIYGKTFDAEVSDAYVQLDATMAIAKELVAEIEAGHTADIPERIQLNLHQQLKSLVHQSLVLQIKTLKSLLLLQTPSTGKY